MTQGRVVAIEGSVVDMRFDQGTPAIGTRIVGGVDDAISIEVAGLVGPGTARGLVLSQSDALSLGMPVRSTGAPLQVPVGPSVLGRMLNVFGEAIDLKGALEDVERRPLQGRRVPLSRRRVQGEIFETGIKAIDLLSPLERGGKAGLLRRLKCYEAFAQELCDGGDHDMRQFGEVAFLHDALDDGDGDLARGIGDEQDGRRSVTLARRQCALAPAHDDADVGGAIAHQFTDCLDTCLPSVAEGDAGDLGMIGDGLDEKLRGAAALEIDYCHANGQAAAAGAGKDHSENHKDRRRQDKSHGKGGRIAHESDEHGAQDGKSHGLVFLIRWGSCV